MLLLVQAQLRRAAAEVGLRPDELAAVLGPVQRLPELREEDLELEQACWFHRAWLTRALPGELCVLTESGSLGSGPKAGLCALEGHVWRQ